MVEAMILITEKPQPHQANNAVITKTIGIANLAGHLNPISIIAAARIGRKARNASKVRDIS